ncbi:MAG: polyprenyl synthetase family protein [Kofleriaceae bacterium]|nr:polyprenyl synthetase family protein [Kofleriaceae bacterium]
MSAPTATLDPRSAPPELARWLAAAAAQVDHQLERWLVVPADDPGRLWEAMRYAALGPGKRLRPALVYAACEAAGGARAQADALAAAIEMLHAYTLVHDDLPAMDDDDLRRGRPTVHVVFGEAIAILAGDGLLTQAFAAAGSIGAGAGAAVTVLAQRAGAGELLAGQAIDLTTTRTTTPTLAELERLHAAKTGALFAAACQLGAIAAGAESARVAQLGRYGECVGIAFQHADDRDDGEFPELAGAARDRTHALCAEAAQLVAGLPASATLAAFAAWIAARA